MNWLHVLLGSALVVFTSVGLVVADARQGAPEQTSNGGSSLQETNDWMKDQLLKFAKYSETYSAKAPGDLFPAQTLSASIEKADLNGCRWEIVLSLISKRFDGTIASESHFQSTMQLQDLETNVARQTERRRPADIRAHWRRRRAYTEYLGNVRSRQGLEAGASA
jgi:hypothetical protein